MSLIKQLEEIRDMQLEITLTRKQADQLAKDIETIPVKVKVVSGRKTRKDVIGRKVVYLAEVQQVLLKQIVAKTKMTMAIEAQVDTLPSKQRLVVWLRYIEGYEWDEVARVMKYSERQCRRYHEAFLKNCSS